MTSSTPFSPLATSGRRKLSQKAPSSLVPTSRPYYLPLALRVHRRAHHDTHVDYPASLPNLLCQRIQPQVRIRSAVQRSAKELLYDLIQPATNARHLALGDALASERFHLVLSGRS